MSEKKSIVTAALWVVCTGSVGRALGLVGTLVLARFLAPEVVAEVTVAAVIAFTGNWIASWGCGQYVMVRGGGGQEVIFAATLLHAALGLVTLCLLWALSPWLALRLQAPELALYLPGALLAVWIRRLATIPDKLLARDLRFARLATATGLGDLAYALTAVGLVLATPLRGGAMVAAFIVQSCVIAAITISGVSVRRWLAPVRIGAARWKDLLRFGAPVTAEMTLSEGARYWDKPLMLRLVGADAAGSYNLAFNLAHLPALYIGGHIGTVMLPAIVRATPHERGPMIIRVLTLTAVVLFPLAFGLAACAGTLVEVLLPEQWAGVAPLLRVLAATSVLAPASFMLASFLAALGENGALVRIELASVLTLVAALVLLSPWGVVVASAAVGIALAAQLGMSLASCRRHGMVLRPALAPLARLLLASAAMVAAVSATSTVLGQVMSDLPLLLLAAEVAVGAAVYMGACSLLVHGLLVDVVRLLRPGAPPTPIPPGAQPQTAP